MDITEIRIKLVESSEDRLRAFCSITIDDCFVVRDLKIIDGSNGPFVAMPSRKLTGHCGRCNHKNHLRAAYCNNCGGKLRMIGEGHYESPQKLYADVAHPINSECREDIQNAVISEFNAELRRAAQPGYRSRYDDDFSDAGPESVQVDAIDKPNSTSATSAGAAPAGQTPNSQNSSSAKPPRPHFLDGSKRGKSQPQLESGENADDQDDRFGEGIF